MKTRILSYIAIACLAIAMSVNSALAATKTLVIEFATDFESANLTTQNGASVANGVSFARPGFSGQTVAVFCGDFQHVTVDVAGSGPPLLAEFSAGNIVRLVFNSGTDTFIEADNMAGGANGILTFVHSNGSKVFTVGDFTTMGGGSNFKDFAIWTESNEAWDSCTAKLYGYDGFEPEAIEINSGIATITLEQDSEAYGGIEDDAAGWQTIPWSTDLIDWDISGENWENWR